MTNIRGSDWEILKILYQAKQVYYQSTKKNHIKNVDLANELNISKAAVSKLLTELKTRNLIEKDGREFFLTKEGVRFAQFYMKK